MPKVCNVTAKVNDGGITLNKNNTHQLFLHKIDMPLACEIFKFVELAKLHTLEAEQIKDLLQIIQIRLNK